MGVEFGDVVTSAPSVWGAMNASSAAIVLPLAWPVAILLGTLVSDPAQMWHAGERYDAIATHVRAATTQMTEAVNRRADADHWAEEGRNAFVATRVRPYQQRLKRTAARYDDIKGALHN